MWVVFMWDELMVQGLGSFYFSMEKNRFVNISEVFHCDWVNTPGVKIQFMAEISEISNGLFLIKTMFIRLLNWLDFSSHSFLESVYFGHSKSVQASQDGAKH